MKKPRLAIEAVRATGASGAQTTTYGIVPQVLPAFAGISVFRWDINIRESTVLGLVGAGGIGLPLNACENWFRVTKGKRRRSGARLAGTEVKMKLLPPTRKLRLFLGPTPVERRAG